MWIVSCFKASKETEAKVHSKLQDIVLVFHSSLVFLMSGVASVEQDNVWE